MKWLIRVVLPLFLLLFSGYYSLYAQGHQDELHLCPQLITTADFFLPPIGVQQADAQLTIWQTFAERGKEKLETTDNEDEEEEVTAVKKCLYNGNYFAAYFARAPGAYTATDIQPVSHHLFSYSSLQRYILLRVIRI
ncbi:hypothetical protein [Taibaiella koreensis]|uniref:hypothetical protein n=1 Tax=Taibaiella koreensis TaxID=1268548 RepID=UPI0013C2D920|nr:hypothetical protein [Taibaiella koreensis]